MRIVIFALASYPPHQTRGGCRVGRMPELHNKSSHGAAQHFVSFCSLCEHHSVLMMTWSPRWEKKGEIVKKKLVRTKHKHNVLTKRDIIFQEKLMRASADADVIFVVS